MVQDYNKTGRPSNRDLQTRTFLQKVSLVTCDESRKRMQVSETWNPNTIRVSKFSIGHANVLAREDISAPVSYDQNEAIFTAEIASLRLTVHAETRSELDDAIADELALVWKRYAKADDAKLTPAAKVLKDRMLAAFREEPVAKKAS